MDMDVCAEEIRVLRRPHQDHKKQVEKPCAKKVKPKIEKVPRAPNQARLDF